MGMKCEVCICKIAGFKDEMPLLVTMVTVRLTNLLHSLTPVV